MTTREPSVQRQRASTSSNSGNNEDTTMADHFEKVKVAKPDYFYGDRNKLDDWLNQLLLYIELEGVAHDKRTLFAASYLRGEAQHWFRARLTAKLVSDEDPERLFADFRRFIVQVRAVYGTSNEVQTAIRMIQTLTQKTSASQYTAKFKEYDSTTGWDDQALMTMYKRGLKENVKDELMRHGAATDTLPRLIKAAIEIDDKLYERYLEKRNPGQSDRGRTGYVPYGGTDRGRRRDPDAMEIDATQTRPKGKFRGGKANGKSNGKPREGLKCYNCQKTGHFARDCRGPKRVRPSEQLNATFIENEPYMEEARGGHNGRSNESVPHGQLSWTACHDDGCNMHRSSKDDSGWYPKGPRHEINVITAGPPRNRRHRDDGYHARGRSPPLQNRDYQQPYRPWPSSSDEDEGGMYEENIIDLNDPPSPGMTSYEGSQLPAMNDEEDISDLENLPPAVQEVPDTPNSYGLLPDIDDSDALNESTPEDSSDEYSDDDRSSDIDAQGIDIQGPQPVLQMVLIIARRYEEIFPVVQGKRRLDPIEFESMLTALRSSFWNYRKIAYDYSDWPFTRECIPIGSRQLPNQSYVTPDGLLISSQMRDRLRIMTRRFQEICKIQQRYQDKEISQEQLNEYCRTHMQHWSLSPQVPKLPAVQPLTTWTGTLLGRKVSMRGLFSITMPAGHTIIRPKEDGPLNWEICFHPDEESKN